MHVRVLGQLHVEIDGVRLELQGSKRRALFAYLAVHAGRPCSLDRLVEAIWDERPRRGLRAR